MRAGQLRNRIVIERNAGTKTASGGMSESWVTFATRWARVRPLSTTERIRAGGQDISEITHEVTIRHTAGVTADMRVIHGTRILDIVAAPQADERRREVVLSCREVVR
jgi:SPP1 family predicted phage head-tail adaptor